MFGESFPELCVAWSSTIARRYDLCAAAKLAARVAFIKVAKSLLSKVLFQFGS